MSRVTPIFQRWVTCLLAVAMIGWLPTWSAADDPRTDTSLRFVPGDAAFYASMLNNRKQLEALQKSNLFKSLASNPTVQLGLMQLKEMLDNPEAQDYSEIIDFFRVPENKEILDVLGDSVSHEVFMYAGGGYAETLGKLQSVSTAVQQAQLDALANGEDPEQAASLAMIEQLKAIDRMPLGELVIGMKVEDTERAQRQLARLENLANQAVESIPELQGRFKREKVGNADLMTLTVDGTMIPWDQIPLDDLKAQADGDTVDELVRKIKKSKLVVSLGMYDKYILLSIGENNDHIANFGKGKLLIDRAELKGLVHAKGRPLTSVSYISEAFVSSSQSVDTQLDNSAKMISAAVGVAGLPANITEQIKDDITDVFGDLKKFTPEPGAVFAYSFMTKDGYEGYGYNWAENIYLDGSKPLTILNHVGGDPIAFAASRTNGSEDMYKFLKKVATRSIFYIDSFGVEEMDQESRQVYEIVREEALPLLRRFDEVTTDLLLPSVKDGQAAIVIDAQLLETKWHEAMPPAEIPLPFPEFGYVLGLSSADQFKKAVSSYVEIGRDAIAKIREASPEEIPPFDVPPPMVRGYDFGEIYYYQIPPEVGLNKLIAPNAGISADTLAITMIPRQTKRLLESNPPKVGNDLISMDKPLASAAHFNFERLLNAIEPWVYYAVEEGSKEDIQGQLEDLGDQFGGDLGLGGDAPRVFEIPDDFEEVEDAANEAEAEAEAEGEKGNEEFGIEEFGGDEEPRELTEDELEEQEEQRKFTVQLINQQVKEVFNVLRCFKSLTVVTYTEGDATVTRARWQFQDLPAK